MHVARGWAGGPVASRLPPPGPRGRAGEGERTVKSFPFVPEPPVARSKNVFKKALKVAGDIRVGYVEYEPAMPREDLVFAGVPLLP